VVSTSSSNREDVKTMTRFVIVNIWNDGPREFQSTFYPPERLANSLLGEAFIPSTLHELESRFQISPLKLEIAVHLEAVSGELRGSSHFGEVVLSLLISE